MSVKIRLTRMGRKKRPFYRIVVTDSRAPRDGGYIECLGTYNPISDPVQIDVEEDRTNFWLDRGAIPTDTVRNILQRRGIIYKRLLLKKGMDSIQIEEEMKKWEVLQIERERREEAKAEKKKKKAEKAPIESEDVVPPGEEKETEAAPEVVAEVKAESEAEQKVEATEDKAESIDETAEGEPVAVEAKETEEEVVEESEETPKEESKEAPEEEPKEELKEEPKEELKEEPKEEPKEERVEEQISEEKDTGEQTETEEQKAIEEGKEAQNTEDNKDA